MSSDLRKKLASERAPTTWRDVETTGQSSAVVVVDPRLDLVVAAVALAENDIASVKQWMGSGLLKNAGPAELAAWRAAPNTVFDMLIVQPFVLLQQHATAHA